MPFNSTTKKYFEKFYSQTVGFDFYTFNICFNKKTIIKLQIWDTSGFELYRSLIGTFYKNSSIAIIVYAIDE